jgi:Spy/CpxP family protein refolding chaperone
MKKIFLLAILSVASVLSLKAQYGQGQYGGGGRGRNSQLPSPSQKEENRAPPTPQEVADMETARLTQMLELTPEQVAKLKVISLDYTQQRFALAHELAQLQDRSGMEAKLQGIKMAHDNAIKEILTPEQVVLFAKGGRKKGKGDKKKQPKVEEAAEKTQGATNN